MGFVNRIAHDESQKLAETRGAFPNFAHSIYQDGPSLRNATLTTVAPTGSISIFADCSSGIEPVFALAFMHVVDRGKPTERKLVMSNPIFEQIAREQGFYSEELMDQGRRDGHRAGPAGGAGTLAAASSSTRTRSARNGTSACRQPSSIPWITRSPRPSICRTAPPSKTWPTPTCWPGNRLQRNHRLPRWLPLHRPGAQCGYQDEAKADAKAAEASSVLRRRPKPAAAPAPVAAAPALPATVKPRPQTVFGYTRRVKSPEGTANITIN